MYPQYACDVDRRALKGLVGQRPLVGKSWRTAARVQPNAFASVIVGPAGMRLICTMRWGFPVLPPCDGEMPLVYRLRDIEAVHWRGYVGRGHRCVVPATAVLERDAGSGRLEWFSRPEGEPFGLPGIWRPWPAGAPVDAATEDGNDFLFALVETESFPKAQGRPVVLCDAQSVDRWLDGTEAEVESLIKSSPTDAIVLLPAESEQAAKAARRYSVPCAPSVRLPDKPAMLLTQRQLREVVSHTSDHILRLEKAGKFPKRVRDGRQVGWIRSEVAEWLRDRPEKPPAKERPERRPPPNGHDEESRDREGSEEASSSFVR